MSGLIALLDDVAAIAKVAAASVDDIAGVAAKAGAKAAGVVIDDTAVTPTYVTGFSADRELPIIWRIARGSLKNKLAVLLPGLLALNYVLPGAILPLLTLGGAYLCFEGAEKVVHTFAPHADHGVEQDFDPRDPAHLEEEKVAGAIKTDFILSAEIMVIAMNEIPRGAVAYQATALAAVGIAITALVYGAVGLIVKMDDIGLHLAREGRTQASRGFGRGLVAGMPKLLAVLSAVGTLAMLWVGGSIVLHGLEGMHLWAWPYATIHHLAHAAALAVGALQGLVAWFVTAALDGLFGLVLGLLLIPVGSRVIEPLWQALRGGRRAAH
jgi:hypothetical protein